MKASLLSVDRIEFVRVSVESNPDFSGADEAVYQQLMYNFQGVKFSRQVGLDYPDGDVEDPRHFSFSFRVTLNKEIQGDGDAVSLPYFIDVHAIAYMQYRTDTHVGFDRFRAVRATGYSILYGAVREMVSNLTARSSYGLLMLPAADFNAAASEEAAADVAAWHERKKGAVIDSDPGVCASDSVGSRTKTKSQ